MGSSGNKTKRSVVMRCCENLIDILIYIFVYMFIIHHIFFISFDDLKALIRVYFNKEYFEFEF